MTASNNKQDINRGKQRYKGDRSAMQSLFLKAISKDAPEVLQDLYSAVFPIHQRARRRRKRPCPRCKQSVRGAVYGEEELADDLCFPGFWSAHYDMEKWQSAWDWADRAHLVRGLDLELLKTREALNLAQWCVTEPFWERKKRLPPALKLPFHVQTSPEITFGMPLLEVVWFTLESWADRGETIDDLCWALPPAVKPVREKWTLDDLTEERTDPGSYLDRFIRCRFGRRRGPIFEFVAIGWDILGETRAQAKAAIMRDLEAQLDEKLDDMVRRAANAWYLERSPEVREEEQFQWLVLYQIKNLSYAAVTRNFLKQPAARSDDIRKQTSAVTDAIERAAERVIGPRFKDWLRPGEPGRPRGS